MRPWAVASGDFTTLGGMDRANHALARHLAMSGRDVHLVAHRVAPDLRALRGVHLRRVTRPLGSHLAGAPLVRRAAAAESRGAADGTVCLANGGNADWPATWVHYVHAAHAPAVRTSLLARASSRLGRAYYLRREAEVLPRAAVIVCNSRRTADDVIRVYGVPAKRVHVVYYGSDAGEFGAVSEADRARSRAALGMPPQHLTAVFAGALGDRRKGFDVLFAAWSALVRDPAWDVDLIVAGGGGERAAWMARAEREGLTSRMKFVGFRRDMADVLAAADVFVHPARYEAYGLSVHEAICRGVPAVVTADAGVAEVYPAAMGALLLPNPPDPPSLVAVLRSWRERADEWRACLAPLGQRLRARSWDEMGSELVSLLEAA